MVFCQLFQIRAIAYQINKIICRDHSYHSLSPQTITIVTRSAPYSKPPVRGPFLSFYEGLLDWLVANSRTWQPAITLRFHQSTRKRPATSMVDTKLASL